MGNKKGFTAVILLFLIIAIVLIVMPIIMQNISYHAVSEHERAFFIADSGVRYYIKNQLDSDSNWSDNNTVLTRNFAGGTFTVTPIHPSAPADPTTTIILQSLGQLSVGSTTFNRTVRYTVQMKGPAAFDGRSVLYGGGNGTGSAYFDHINNGTVNGDIYLAGTYTDNKSKNLNVNGSINQHQSQAQIPTVDWAYWQAQASAGGTGHVIDVASLPNNTANFTGTSYAGVYYVYCSTGCLATATLNNNNMVFDGTIVSTGNIALGSGNNITFNPAGTATNKNPAVVAGHDVNIGQGNNVVFGGTIYAYHDIYMDQTNNLTLNGGALVFGNDLTADHTNNAILNTGVRTNSSGFTSGQQTPGGLGAYPIEGFRETQ